MRSDDDLLGNYFRKLVSDRVGSILIRTTKPNKITLIDSTCARKIIKTSVKNTRNFTRMVCINFFMRMIDFDFNFVEYGFGSDEEFTRGRIGSENYSGSTVNL